MRLWLCRPVTAMPSLNKFADYLTTSRSELSDAMEALNGPQASTAAIALPSDEMLWAMALTGLAAEQLVLVEGNEGA